MPAYHPSAWGFCAICATVYKNRDNIRVCYLAMVSAVAYTLWSVLLAWNDVSRVAIFGFVNPLFSVILSALVLGEVRQAFNMGSLIALFLVCVGIYVVNQKKSS